MVTRCLVVIIACLLIVVGCAGNSEPTPTTGNGVMLTYERSGGIAGLRDELTIYYDGRYEVQRNGSETEFTLDRSELTHLENLIQQANFFQLQDNYLPGNIIPDAFQYVISYRTEEGKMHTVHTMTTAVPELLEPVLSELNQIIARHN